MFTKKEVTRKVAVVLAFVFVVVACVNVTVAKANVTVDDEVVASYTYADGITRNLISKNHFVYGEKYIYSSDNYDYEDDVNNLNNYICRETAQIGYDKYGTIWFTQEEEDSEEKTLHVVFYNPYNKEVSGNYDVHRIPYYSEDDGGSYFFDVDSLIFDEKNCVVGFKTVTGDEYPTLDLENQLKLVEKIGDGEIHLVKDYSTYIPEGYVAPTPTSNVTPTPTPTASSSTGTATPTPTPTPDSSEDKNSSSEGTKTTTSSTKASVKTVKGYKVYYKGDTVVGKYKLKKNVLTYKGKKYKKVKKAFFIKKSGNVVFLDKNKKAYLLKGKKKKLLLKGVKKVITSGGFAVKVKGKTKTISVKNK